MSQVFSPYQLDKDTEHLPEPTGSLVCVCVWGGGTLLNPFKPNQLKINLVSYLAPISQVSQNKKQVPLQGWPLGVSAFQQMLKLIQDSKGLSSL